MSTPQVAVAMDWGGTWTRTAVINRQGEILWQSRQANPQGGTKEEYLTNAEGLLATAIQQAGGPVAGIGAAVAGPVEPTTGTFYQPPNLMVLDGVAFKPLWENFLTCRCGWATTPTWALWENTASGLEGSRRTKAVL